MKKEKKYICLLACCVLGLLGMYLLGFKITYAPWLENDWDAIAAVGTWVAAIISGVAVVFAVKIPKTIAAYQNKISLFEKRLSAYWILENVLDAFLKTDDETIADFYPYLAEWICRKKQHSNHFKGSALDYELENTVKTCESISFLFPIDFSEYYYEFIEELKEFILYFNPEKPCDLTEEKRVEKLTDFARQISEKEMEQMKMYIDLTETESLIC